MRTLLGFHFRNDGTGVRGEIFSRVRPIVESLYPWDDVVVLDSGHTPYNRAATRNKIVDYAASEDDSVVVICDADSIPMSQPLDEAIEYAFSHRKIVIPFNNVSLLPMNSFLPKSRKYRDIKPLYKYGESFGGCYVTTPETWYYAGGMDERIEGWGFEDQIILAAAKTFLDGPVYIPGTLYAINHIRDTTSLNDPRNDELVRKYHAAQGNPDEFRAIQRGSNAQFLSEP